MSVACSRSGARACASRSTSTWWRCSSSCSTSRRCSSSSGRSTAKDLQRRPGSAASIFAEVTAFVAATRVLALAYVWRKGGLDVGSLTPVADTRLEDEGFSRDAGLDCLRELGPQEQPLAHAPRSLVLRHRDDGHGGTASYDMARFGAEAAALLPAPERRDDRRRHPDVEDGGGLRARSTTRCRTPSG